jgi:hypothetical protein
MWSGCVIRMGRNKWRWPILVKLTILREKKWERLKYTRTINLADSKITVFRRTLPVKLGGLVK